MSEHELVIGWDIVEILPSEPVSTEGKRLLAEGKLRLPNPFYKIVYRSEDGVETVQATAADPERAIDLLATHIEQSGENGERLVERGVTNRKKGGPYKAKFTLRFENGKSAGGRKKWKTVEREIGPVNVSSEAEMKAHIVYLIGKEYDVLRTSVPQGTRIWRVS